MPLNTESVHIWRVPDGHHYLAWETTDPATEVSLRALGDEAGVTHVLPPGGLARARIAGLPARPRQYFRLADGHGNEVIAPARGLGLPGAVNFRDFGGYATACGRRVRWGELYRSGHLAQLTPAAVEQFEDLAIDLVCDFRREDEQTREPSRLPAGTRRVSIATTPGSQKSALHGASGSIRSRQAMIGAMRDINREFVRSQSDRYAALFEQLLAPGTRRVLVHCAAGKDRTGFAAALILFALGVPRETVIRDYLLTRHYFDPAGELARVRDKYQLHHLGDHDLLPMLEVDQSYLEAALAVIEEEYGTVDTYLERALGVGGAARRELAARYLS
jgi:protein-tyrosine phosphatase